MKKLTSSLINLTLFFAASCPHTTTANNYDQYSGAITIHNQTPFTLAIIEDFLYHPLKSNAKGNLFLLQNLNPHDQFLMPGERKLIGYTEEPLTNEVEGYLVLNFLDTEELFTAHYRFGKSQGGDNGSWIKLEQLDLEQLDNNQPYPFISLRMIRGSVASKNLLSGTHYLHAYMLTFNMDHAAAACITDPYCLGGHFLRTIHKKSAQLKNVEL